jgi:hypothetical protein
MSFLDRIRQAIFVDTQESKNQRPLSPMESKTSLKSKESRKLKSKKLSTKELLTERGEPYVAILSFEIDPENLNSGAFELDWNDKFITNLVRAGYQTKANEPESDIVDRWFQQICRNVVLEYYEQQQADPDLRHMNRKKMSNGRTEIS